MPSRHALRTFWLFLLLAALGLAVGPRAALADAFTAAFTAAGQPTDTSVNQTINSTGGSPAYVQVLVKDTTTGNPVAAGQIVPLQLVDPNNAASLTAQGGGTTQVNPTTVSASTNGSGVAIFRVSVDTVNNNYKLLPAYTRPAGDTVTNTPSNPFQITPGPLKYLTFTTQPTDTVAGQVIAGAGGVVVHARDQYGNPISTMITLSVNGGTPGATLSNNSATSNGSDGTPGDADFTALKITTAGTGYTLTASASFGGATVTTTPGPPNADNADSSPFKITPDKVNAVTFKQPPTTTTAGQVIGGASGVVVHAEDQYHNPVAASVVLALNQGAAPDGGATNATLGGTLTVPTNPNTGDAPFTDLTITAAGTGYTLNATATDTTFGNQVMSAPSGGFAITSDKVNAVTFSTQPTDTVAGQKITPAVVVHAQDQYGNPVSASVQLTLNKPANGPGSGATLAGTNPVSTNPSTGDATFNNLTIQVAAAGYSLRTAATDSVFTNTVTSASAAFNIKPDALSSLTFTQQPSTTQAGVTINANLNPPGVIVLAQDQYHNGIAGLNVNVSLIDPTTGAPATDNQGNAINFSGTTSATTGDGTNSTTLGAAVFAALKVTKPGTYAIRATSTDGTFNKTVTTAPGGQGQPNADSAPFKVQTGAGATLLFTPAPPSSQTAGQPLGVKVTLTDSSGNPVGGQTVTLTLNKAALYDTGASPQTNQGLTVTATTGDGANGTILGVADFSTYGIQKADTGYTLSATYSPPVGSAVTKDSSSFNITAAALASLTFTQQPKDTKAGAAITPAVIVQAQDQYQNPINNLLVSLTLNTGALGGTTAVRTGTDGNATFSNLTVSKVGTYTLTASATDTVFNSTVTTTPGTPGQPKADSAPFNVTLGTLGLTFTPAPPSSQTAGQPLGVKVTLTDASGNPRAGSVVTLAVNKAAFVDTYSGGGSSTVTLAAGGASATATTDANGVADFSTLAIQKADTGYTLTASDAADLVSPITSSLFTITAGAVSTLTFTTQPTNTPAGQRINAAPPGVIVTALDANGNAIPGAVVSVTLLDAASGKLSSTAMNGTTTVVTGDGNNGTVLGQAAFTDLNITVTGAYQLRAASGGVTTGPGAQDTANADSAQFRISPSGSYLLAFSPAPSSVAQAGTPLGTKVTVTDSVGNRVSLATVTLMLNKATLVDTYTGPGTSPVTLVKDSNGNYTSATAKTDSNGVADLSTLTTQKADTGYILIASFNTASAQTAPFTIAAGQVTQLTFTGPPTITAQPTNTAAGAAINSPTGVVVTANDQFGNAVSGVGVTVSLNQGTVPAPGTGQTTGTLSGTTTVNTNGSGYATFTTLSVDKPGTGYTLTAKSGSVTTAPPNPKATPPTKAGDPNVDSQPFTVFNSAVTIASLSASPTSVVPIHVGEPGFTLFVNGMGFAPGVTVQAGTASGNLVTLAVQGFTATEIAASVPAALAAQAGQLTVTVTNVGSITGPYTSYFNVVGLGPAQTNAEIPFLFGVPVSVGGSGDRFYPGLQMFSAPFDYTAPGFQGFLGPDGKPETPEIGNVLQLITPTLDELNVKLSVSLSSAIKIAVWDPTIPNYVTNTGNGTLADTLTLGRGYWGRLPYVAGQHDPTRPFVAGTEVALTMRGLRAKDIPTGGPIDAQRRFHISLKPGWNMIGDPYTASVPTSGLQVLYNGTTDSLDAANTAGFVFNTFYTYGPNAGNYTVSTSLDPYAGYWVYATVACDLLVPAPVEP